MSHITKLEISNALKIRYALLELDGGTVAIGGKNGQGKSAILDCIAMVFGGEKAVPDVALREGAKSGYIRITEDTQTVTERRLNLKGTSLTVKNADGKLLPGTPQALCNEKMAPIHFDPLEFTRMKPDEQLKLVQQLAGVDLDALDECRAETYAERTIINREVKRCKALLDQMAKPEDVPEKEVDVAEVMEEIKKAQAENDGIVAAAKHKVNLEIDVASCKDDVRAAEKQLKAAKAALKKAEKDFAEAPDAPEMIDIAPLEQQITAASEINDKIRYNESYETAAAAYSEALDKAKNMDGEIAEIDEEKNRIISEAEFPMEGLSFDENGVTFNGLPLAQASDGEKIGISAEMGFALCDDPEKLQVMLIKNGSLLDDDNLLILAQKAEQHKVQLFLELVGTDGDILVEDGTIIGQEQPEQ